MKSILIGSVSSSKNMLESMIEVGFPIDFVFSIDEQYSENISDYYPIHNIAAQANIKYKKIKKINDKENIEIIKKINPDYIFVIGISQLISKEIIECARFGTIGFHPAPLPKMRGRAAIVWQILLGIHQTKCSLFFIDEGMDSGDIIGQWPFIIDDNDYASDVLKKLSESCKYLFKDVLLKIMSNSLTSIKQNHSEATYLLKRSPEDGKIDWNAPFLKTYALIRATSHPYPGAFGLYDGEHKIIIWKCTILENKQFIGLNGQIISICQDYIDVLYDDKILRISEFENVDKVKLIVGHRIK